MRACSSALAAVAVRTSTTPRFNGGIMHVIVACKASIVTSLEMHAIFLSGMTSFPPAVALRVFADIPVEVQSRNNMMSLGINALSRMPNGLPSPEGIDLVNDDSSAIGSVMEILQMALHSFISGSGGIHQMSTFF